MFTNQELAKLWSNELKRRAFVHDFKTWGVWFTQPELDLTFYKYDLPDGVRLIAMEYVQAVDAHGDKTTHYKHYLQRGKHFNPSPTCDYEMSNHLKRLKEKLLKEMKQNA